jgi:hypothetical protein
MNTNHELKQEVNKFIETVMSCSTATELQQIELLSMVRIDSKFVRSHPLLSKLDDIGWWDVVLDELLYCVEAIDGTVDGKYMFKYTIYDDFDLRDDILSMDEIKYLYDDCCYSSLDEYINTKYIKLTDDLIVSEVKKSLTSIFTRMGAYTPSNASL